VTIANQVAVLRAAPDDLRTGDKVVVSPLAETTEGMAVKEGETDRAAKPQRTASAPEGETK